MSRNYKPTLKWFAGRMAAKLGLKKNLDKPHWSEDDTYDLYKKLRHELGELDSELFVACAHPDERVRVAALKRVILEAADVANFAMMIADNARHGRAPRRAKAGGTPNA